MCVCVSVGVCVCVFNEFIEFVTSLNDIEIEPDMRKMNCLPVGDLKTKHYGSTHTHGEHMLASHFSGALHNRYD